MELVGRVALVTGGSRGLGKAITEELLRGGAHVMVMAREQAVLSEAVAGFQLMKSQPDQKVLAVSGDVALADDVNRAVAETCQKLGRLDVLVCNAGNRTAPSAASKTSPGTPGRTPSQSTFLAWCIVAEPLCL